MGPLEAWAARHGVSSAALVELSTIFHSPLDSIPGGSEAMVQAALRVEAPKHGGALWRNNSGALMDDTGRLVRFGLGHDSKRLNDVWKSSDLIGITRGRFTAVEVKAPGWTKPTNAREHAQAAFLATVESLGGIGMFATSVDDYRARIK